MWYSIHGTYMVLFIWYIYGTIHMVIYGTICGTIYGTLYMVHIYGTLYMVQIWYYIISSGVDLG